jgi:class 3 adenylate cyclase
MIRGEDVSGDHFDHAAILFVDVVSFTSNTSHMPPADVVKLLETIFRTIDGLCDSQNVVKVKTIGDSYMCFRGDGDATTNARSIANVALDVLHEAFTWPTGEPLRFRAGIHIGPATAGVIGTQRLQYDVWGDTVNVASRMESTGEPGKIHVSEAFAAVLTSPPSPLDDHGTSTPSALDDHGTSPPSPLSSLRGGTSSLFPVPCSLRERGALEIKGKGMMTTYWLEGANP